MSTMTTTALTTCPEYPEWCEWSSENDPHGQHDHEHYGEVYAGPDRLRIEKLDGYEGRQIALELGGEEPSIFTPAAWAAFVTAARAIAEWVSE